jgi:hypothetical protein
VADGAPLGVDYDRPHEGGDARRPVIGMLCHRSALCSTTLPTNRHVSPTCCRSVQQGAVLINSPDQRRGLKRSEDVKRSSGNLDFHGIHKHTAITAVIRGRRPAYR